MRKRNNKRSSSRRGKPTSGIAAYTNQRTSLWSNMGRGVTSSGQYRTAGTRKSMGTKKRRK